MRILHELNRLKMNITRVFLTGVTWQNHIAGLPTLLKCHGALKGKVLSVYGPEGINKFLKDVSTFSSTGLQRLQSLKLFESLEITSSSSDGKVESYVDDNVTISPVILERKDPDVGHSEKQSICYICEFADLPGHFLPDKATELGVTQEWFNELTVGNPVLSSYGRKVRSSRQMKLSFSTLGRAVSNSRSRLCTKKQGIPAVMVVGHARVNPKRQVGPKRSNNTNNEIMTIDHLSCQNSDSDIKVEKLKGQRVIFKSV